MSILLPCSRLCPTQQQEKQEHCLQNLYMPCSTFAPQTTTDVCFLYLIQEGLKKCILRCIFFKVSVVFLVKLAYCLCKKPHRCPDTLTKKSLNQFGVFIST